MSALPGVVLRSERGLSFVPAGVALRVTPAPRLTEVPGGPAPLAGIALHDGSVVPVVAIGSRRGEMLVCAVGGERIGVVGGQVVRTGTFPESTDAPGAVRLDGELALPLDLEDLVAQIRAGSRLAVLGSP